MHNDPASEPAIDLSLSHYMEDKALATALAKSETEGQRARVEHLIKLQSALMERRQWFNTTAVARRHAREEIYSKARVEAINAMGPTRESMDASVKSLYLRQPDCEGVLKSHALTHFTAPLVSQRLGLVLMPADIALEAREMLIHEEAFATAWIAAVDDPVFAREVQRRRREAMALFRTATRPMHLVTFPAQDDFNDEDARELGKIWKNLDTLAGAIGAQPLSNFIAFGDEGDAAGAPAQDILQTINALLVAVESPGEKFSSRKKTLSLLGKVRHSLMRLEQLGGCAFFEVDI